MKTRLLFLSLFAILYLPLQANGERSLFDEIQLQEEILEVELTTDLDALLTPIENTEYQKASIRFAHSGKAPASWDLKIKARGRYRYRICDFPPIKLNFDKDDLQAAGLAAYDKYKLVTHCFDNEAEARDNVLREYMAYRLYNEVTDQSFRVQLVKITYIDSNDPKKLKERWGVLIESTDEMAARIGGEEVDLLNQPEDSFDLRAEHRMSVFQYLIGNSDYDLRMVRNIKLVKMHETGKLVPVPYDFDFSLLVNAEYAVPNNNAGQMRIEDRVYLGFDHGEDQVRYMDKYYESMRKQFEEAIKETEMVNRSNRNYMLKVLESFFESQEVREGLYAKSMKKATIKELAPTK
ncbi:MAG: hypothetical protein GYB31_06740 [Bacteroidetes bacterium]|nr:hypothetical protein [Bacteroidota bacterium]